MTEAPVEAQTRILLVDDELLVLEGLRLHLDRHYAVTIATSAAQGLRVLRQGGAPFAMVMSDMRMPGMDGATFLGEVRELSPDTTRVILTGQADLDAAIEAVNVGQVFRFLTKPCPGHVLMRAVTAAVELHRLITAERVLLSQTLTGSIRALMGMLNSTHPTVLERAARTSHRARQLCEMLGQESWDVEIAGMISHVPMVALGTEVLERHFAGLALNEQETAALEAGPTVASGLVAHIPRLESVQGILRHLNARFDGRDASAGTPRGEHIPLGSRILKAIQDLDLLECQGIDRGAAGPRMRLSGAYDPKVLAALERLPTTVLPTPGRLEVALRDLRPGMVLLEDLVTTTGRAVLKRGALVTDEIIQHLAQFPEGGLREPVGVESPGPAEH